MGQIPSCERDIQFGEKEDCPFSRVKSGATSPTCSMGHRARGDLFKLVQQTGALHTRMVC
jgi:hypothetical protein